MRSSARAFVRASPGFTAIGSAFDRSTGSPKSRIWRSVIAAEPSTSVVAAGRQPVHYEGGEPTGRGTGKRSKGVVADHRARRELRVVRDRHDVAHRSEE